MSCPNAAGASASPLCLGAEIRAAHKVDSRRSSKSEKLLRGELGRQGNDRLEVQRSQEWDLSISACTPAELETAYLSGRRTGRAIHARLDHREEVGHVDEGRSGLFGRARSAGGRHFRAISREYKSRPSAC